MIDAENCAVARKLSDRRLRRGRYQLYIEWRDIWAGAYIGPDAVYYCVFCIVLRVAHRNAPSATGWSRAALRPEHVDPTTLIEALTKCGWTVLGGVDGVYTRLLWPGQGPRGRQMMIPMDRDRADYLDLMQCALLGLMDTADTGREADAVLTAMATGEPLQIPEPTALDEAMASIYLHGSWRFLTMQMTTEQKEAALAAVLRADRWAKQDEPAIRPWTREDLAWWDN